MQTGRQHATKGSGEARQLARELRRIKDLKELGKRFKKEGGLKMSQVRLEVFFEEYQRRGLTYPE